MELIERPSFVKAVFAEHGHFFGAGLFGHGAVDLDFADANVRELAFLQDVRTTDAG